jgi:hypothetical protein
VREPDQHTNRRIVFPPAQVDESHGAFLHDVARLVAPPVGALRVRRSTYGGGAC